LYVLYDKGIVSRYKVETGERVFRSRIAPGASAFTASPWAYDGKVFLLSEEGNTYVMEAGEEYRLLGVNTLDEFALATPAIVGDRLLIRTQHHLYSIRQRRGDDVWAGAWPHRSFCGPVHAQPGPGPIAVSAALCTVFTRSASWRP
jgi:hypothetical protein